MNVEETIQAAIAELELWQTHIAFVGALGPDEALNVSLAEKLWHRTVDAQHGLLRVAANNPGCETDEEVALANAILGERT